MRCSHFRGFACASSRDNEAEADDAMLQQTGRKYPNNKCLGWRDQDKIKKTWGPYQWIDYKTVQERRTNLGMGLRYLHQKAGVS